VDIAKSYLKINGCLQEFLCTLSYLVYGVWGLNAALFVRVGHAHVGELLPYSASTLQARVNLLSPGCPSPPGFASFPGKNEGVNSLYLNVYHLHSIVLVTVLAEHQKTHTALN